MTDWAAPHLSVDENVPLADAVDEAEDDDDSEQSWEDTAPEDRALWLSILDQHGIAHDDEGNLN